MLQFDDASLARLIRAVRAVPYDKRKIFLKKLGAAIDPSPALRRYRNRNGPLPLVVVDAADSRRDLAFFSRSCRPAEVGSILRPNFWNSARPTCSSSRSIWRLTADTVRPTRSAAAANVPASAMATKVRRKSTDRVRFIVEIT